MAPVPATQILIAFECISLSWWRESAEFDGGNGFTGATEQRRRTESRSIGRRAQRADSRDVRERKYQPLWPVDRRLVFVFSYITVAVKPFSPSPSLSQRQ